MNQAIADFQQLSISGKAFPSAGGPTGSERIVQCAVLETENDSPTVLLSPVPCPSILCQLHSTSSDVANRRCRPATILLFSDPGCAETGDSAWLLELPGASLIRA